MATISANHFKFRIHQTLHKPIITHLEKAVKIVQPRRKLKPPSCALNTHRQFHFFNPKKSPRHSFPSRVSGDPEAGSQQSVSDVEPTYSNLSSSDDTYLPLLIRMLGLDNDPLDREQAIIALWKYSLGGKKYVDSIMQFRGCITLSVNLLRSESNPACEASAGLLRMISSVNSFRDLVAESGAIEETTALLRRSSLTSEVKEQSICMLWNLSADEKLRVKIANTTLLPLLIKFLDDEDIKVIEAAGGVLANLALSPSNHKIMVEAGVIPKLAKFLTSEVEGSKIIRREAKNALLELAKDDFYRILVMEEGLVHVPLVGANAYTSYKPALHSWPSLPDGTEFKRSSKGPSRYGASELLLGLNKEENTDKINESKMDAIVGRTQQQFLARIGAIENEDEKKLKGDSSSLHYTLLPWKDGIARLVLILELEDEIAITRAANAIAAASVNERMRAFFREAGAVKHLVRLLDHSSGHVRSAVVGALEKLSVSNILCGTMEEEGVTYPLINILKEFNTTESLMEKTLSILARILDPHKGMKLKFYDGPINGSTKVTDSRSGDLGLRGNVVEMENMLGSTLVTRLVDILKTGSSSVQTKVASILEFASMTEPCMDTIIASNIGSILIAIFQQYVPRDLEGDLEDDEEPNAAYLEEAGLVVSSASRLLTRLLDHHDFRNSIDPNQFTKLLRQILKSDIPLHYKEWVASCLVKLTSSSTLILENPITTEITLYETIPRLIDQIKTSFSAETQEAAVVELNRIISEGVVGSTRAVVAHGGIFPLVKLIEEGNERSIEAGLAVLYNLSMDSENHSEILAAGVVPVLRRIVLSEKPQWMRALRLLRNLPI